MWSRLNGQFGVSLAMTSAVVSEQSDLDVGHFELRSDPVSVDVDGDGLEDPVEVDGWNVSVINRSGGPYKFDTESERTGIQNGQIQWTNCAAPDESIHVDSDALDPDSDDDSLTDYVEYNVTYSDPQDDRTYGITHDHQQFIDDMEGDWRLGNKLGIVHERSLSEVLLDDATDDFDFVMTDGSSPRDRAIFTALDGEQRSDKWFSNRGEINYNFFTGSDLDVWDPDTDDDGLTDGQEVSGLTWSGTTFGGVPYLKDDHQVSYFTDPENPDSDGDGYWDGWFGVYGVDRTDNVVLYRENLQTGGGVAGDESVPEQAGTHRVNASELTHANTTVTNNGTQIHSNLHIGELHWEFYDPSQTGDPSDPAVTPDPSLDVEVDYHTSVAGTNAMSYLERAEYTFALYGLDVEYHVDEEIDSSDSPEYPWGGRMNLKRPNGSIAFANAGVNHDSPDRTYMFITHDGGSSSGLGSTDFSGTPYGKASCQGADFRCGLPVPTTLDWGIAIFYEDSARSAVPTRESLIKTYVHETGHIIGLGRNDDGTRAFVLPVEVYSGGSQDSTDESLDGSQPNVLWSAMSPGWRDQVAKPPMDGSYIAISIEEAFTVEFNELERGAS